MKDHLRLFLQAIRHAFDFTGRATRAEFLTYIVLSQAPLVLATWIAPDPYEAGVRLGFVLLAAAPLPALAIRRLHDFGTDGRWSLILLVPVLRFAALELLTQAAGWEARSIVEGLLAYIDWLLFLPAAALYVMLLAAPGTKGTNRFGPGPAAATETAGPESPEPAA